MPPFSYTEKYLILLILNQPLSPWLALLQRHRDPFSTALTVSVTTFLHVSLTEEQSQTTGQTPSGFPAPHHFYYPSPKLHTPGFAGHKGVTEVL